MEKLKVTYRAIETLVPYERNARTHSDEQLEQIAASITEFGFTTPVLVDGESGIIAGHARVEAARRLGLDKVPCIERADLTDAQRRAYIIADNRLAELAGWDAEVLGIELKELRLEEFDLELVGFTEDEVDGYIAIAERSTGLVDEEETPEAQEKAVTIEGELWTMGGHRLVCGDSTDASDVALLLDGVEPHLMVTDQPWGVEYDANWRNNSDRANGKPIGARAVAKVVNDDRADWKDAWAHFPGEIIYLWHAGKNAHISAQSLIDSGFEIRSQIIWAKNNIVIGRGHYHQKHEPCWYAVRKGGKGNWVGGRKQSSIWNIDKPMKSETGHSTQKPVECMRRPMENNSNPGQVVYDPFIGSGTSIIAAETTGRKCYGLEIMPVYCDIAVRRWQNFTGKDAVNQEGRTFNELEAERGGS